MRKCLVTFVIAVGLSLSALTAAAEAAFPGANGKIVFDKSNGNSNQIYTLDPNAPNPSSTITDLSSFIPTPGNAYSPHWSPDGTKIVFTLTPFNTQHSQIYTMNPDASGATRVSGDPNVDYGDPAWSPDGRQIVFTRFSGSCSCTQIYKMDADGSNETPLSNSGLKDYQPAWSPDGTKIAFARENAAESSAIYVMDADGNGKTRLTCSCFARNPDWSPDGTEIAFFETDNGGNRNIWVMNADGSAGGQLTFYPINPPPGGYADYPGWSSDGTKIAFQVRETQDTNPQGYCCQIFMMDANGGNKTNLTNFPNTSPISEAENPDWQPLGRTSVSATTDPGGTVSTNATATPSNPMATSVTTPSGGAISISEQLANGVATFNITAPGESTTAPLRIVFRFDPSAFPGRSPSSLQVEVDGTPVPGCNDTSGTAAPNPCVEDRRKLDDGELQVTVLSSHASLWTISAPYPTPVGASPIRVSLVPTFQACDPQSADSSHPAPLSSPSCTNPEQTSSTATIGKNSLGFSRMVACPQGTSAPFCNPTPSGSLPLPDLRLTASIRDVTCAKTGTPSGCVAGDDYDPSSGQGPYSSGGSGTVGASPACLPSGSSSSDCAAGADLTEKVTLQITDRQNGPGQDVSATTADVDYAIPIDCLPTADTTVGSTCGVNTTANALTPGAVVAGASAIWRTPDIRVYDSGPNGTRGDNDDELFEAQGVFAP
jgi:Tol biopolymer transport system component